jgi:hypothetical protein
MLEDGFNAFSVGENSFVRYQGSSLCSQPWAELWDPFRIHFQVGRNRREFGKLLVIDDVRFHIPRLTGQQ